MARETLTSGQQNAVAKFASTRPSIVKVTVTEDRVQLPILVEGGEDEVLLASSSSDHEH